MRRPLNENGCIMTYCKRLVARWCRESVTAGVIVALVLFAAGPAWADPAASSQSQAAAAPAESGSDLPTLLFIFMLASFIGLGVVTRVSRLLHTPLMSITNAISAIAIVGAITVAGSDHPWPITVLGAIALFASTTNIVSGFLITDRMLKMFKRNEPPTR